MLFNVQDINCSRSAKIRKLEVESAGSETLWKSKKYNDVEFIDSSKGVLLRSENGHRWRLSINNDGALSTIDIDG